jgi:hypothetical protein
MLWITLEGLLCRGFNVEMLRDEVTVLNLDTLLSVDQAQAESYHKVLDEYLSVMHCSIKGSRKQSYMKKVPKALLKH